TIIKYNYVNKDGVILIFYFCIIAISLIVLYLVAHYIRTISIMFKILNKIDDETKHRKVTYRLVIPFSILMIALTIVMVFGIILTLLIHTDSISVQLPSMYVIIAFIFILTIIFYVFDSAFDSLTAEHL